MRHSWLKTILLIYMAEKYIRKNNSIVKNSKTYAKLSNLDDAITIRDLLVGVDWNLDEIPQIIRQDDNYLVLAVIDEKIHLLSKYKSEPDRQTVENLTKKRIRNPNNSRYGLNISKVFDTYVIKKRIAGEDYIFGYYDSLEDAEFVRNFLLGNEWNVSKFRDIEFDDETDTYKVVKVIDDKVYVLDSFDTPQIDLNKSYEQFLSKISKHKYGLSNYPHLDFLTPRIAELEDELNVKAKDDYWSFENISDDSSPLNDIIFKLTPFEKSVYDAIDGETSLDEIEHSLIRYKSKNFDKKILKNIDKLIGLNLIENVGYGIFRKTNL